MKKLYIFLIFIFLIVSCGEEKVENTINVVTNSQISISPDYFDVNTLDTATFTLKLSNPGNFKWQIENRPNWLMVSQEKGTFTGDSLQFQAMIDQSRAKNSRIYLDSFLIVTNGAGSCQAVVSILNDNITPPEIIPKDIYFPEDISSQLITFRNPDDDNSLGFYLWSDVEWIDINSAVSCYLKKGGECRYNLKIDKSRLPVGQASAKIAVIYGGLTKVDTMFINIRADVPKSSLASFNTDTLLFMNHEDSKFFYVKNLGNSVFDFDMDNTYSEINFSPSSGAIAVGDSVKVKVVLNRGQIKEGIHAYRIPMSGLDGEPVDNIVLQVENYKGRVINVDCYVNDAVYNKHTDELILITENPNELRIYNLNDNNYKKIVLERNFSNLAISPNGKRVAIGGYKKIVYYELYPLKHIVTKSVSEECSDIVISDNDWAFVSPQSGDIFGYNFTTDVKANFERVSATYQSTLSLLPDGKHLVCGYQNKEFLMYDVSNEYPKYIYKSPRNEVKEGGNKFWITEDGSKLITARGNIHEISNEAAADFLRIGSLGASQNVIAMDYSARIDKFCAGLANDYVDNEYIADKLSIFNGSTFELEEQIVTPKKLVLKKYDGKVFEKSPIKCCFFNSSGNQIVSVSRGRYSIYHNYEFIIYVRDL